MQLLRHNDLVVAPLGSGSRGNSTYIGTERRGILVDCGLSTKQILLRLEHAGLGDVTIDGVLVTHEHADHVGAARILDAKLFKRQHQRVPFFMTPGTAEGVRDRCRPTDISLISSGESFCVGKLRVEPTSVPHDTLDPVAFAVEHQGVRAGVLTDLGRTTRGVERMLASLHLAVVEFNHDTAMLRDGPYPWALKQRVRGAHGHLSNDQGAKLLEEAASARLKHVHLGHLSDENNTPQLAMEAAQAALARAGRRKTDVSIAAQDHASEVVRVTPEETCEPRAESATQQTAAPQLGLFA